MVDLNLGRCPKISNKPLFEVINNCVFLENLEVRSTGVTDEIFAYLARNSERLQFDEQLHNAHLFNMCKTVKNGQRFCEYFTINFGWNLASLNSIILSCPLLQHVSFAGYSTLTDSHIMCVIDDCPLLHTISLLNNPQLTSQVIKYITLKCIHLHTLEVNAISDLTDEMVCILVTTRGHQIRRLSFEDCSLFTDIHLLYKIADYCVNLVHLNVAGCYMLNDCSVENLVRTCKKLYYLDISRCVLITDSVLSVLSSLPDSQRLKCLKIKGCQLITPQAVKLLLETGKMDEFESDDVHFVDK
jgi:hypothetical protein